MAWMYKMEHYSILTFLVIVLSGIGLLGILDAWVTNHKRSAFRAISFGVIFSICLLEFGLRIIKHQELSSYQELTSKNFIKKYKSVYDQGDLSYMYEGVRNTSYCFNAKEFEYCRSFNEWGIPDVQIIDTAKSNIIFLGDSFTEGVGAAQDATVVAHFNLLTNQKYNCINAGIGGSDLFFQWKLYQYNLPSLQPKAIVFILNSTEIGDVSIRGGDERFEAEGVIVKHPPFWEPIFASSYIVRQICKIMTIDWTLETASKREATHSKAISQINDKLIEIGKYGKENGIQIFYVLHPLKEECISGAFISPKLTSVLNAIPDHQILNTLDSFSQLNNCELLYWKIDKHFNSLGYLTFAEIILENLGNQLEMIE